MRRYRHQISIPRLPADHRVRWLFAFLASRHESPGYEIPETLNIFIMTNFLTIAALAALRETRRDELTLVVREDRRVERTERDERL